MHDIQDQWYVLDIWASNIIVLPYFLTICWETIGTSCRTWSAVLETDTSSPLLALSIYLFLYLNLIDENLFGVPKSQRYHPSWVSNVKRRTKRKLMPRRLPLCWSWNQKHRQTPNIQHTKLSYIKCLRFSERNSVFCVVHGLLIFN